MGRLTNRSLCHFSGKFVLMAAFLVGLFLLNSCAYRFSRSTLPSHLKTIVIEPVENRTYQSILGDKIKEEISSGFRREAPSLRQVNEGGHCELRLTFKNYSNKAMNYSSGGQVSEYQTIITVSVEFYDVIKDKMLYENANLQGIGIYNIAKGETEERHGQEAAMEDLKELLVSNLLSNW